MATSVLLLNGYIRQIEELLSSTQIIPESITSLCIKFYYASNLLFYLLHKESSFFIADIGNQNQWKCNVYPLKFEQGNFPHSTKNRIKRNNNKYFKPSQLQINEGGLCYVHDIKLPKLLSRTIHSAYFQQVKDTQSQPAFDSEPDLDNVMTHNDNHNDKDNILSKSERFDVIFQCGGLNTTQCNAIIIDNNLIQRSPSEAGMLSLSNIYIITCVHEVLKMFITNYYALISLYWYLLNIYI